MKEGLKKLMGELAEWAITVGPILAAIGIMRAEKGADGKQTFVPNKEFTTHAKSKMFGIGVDDEAIVAAIFGQLKNGDDASGKIEAGKKISAWLAKLKQFQQDRFRLVLTKIVSEFSEGKDEKTKESVGISHAIDFLKVLASLPTDKERTKLCLSLNIINKKPPITDKAFQAVKKIKPEKIVDYIAGEMDTCDKIVRKNFFMR